MRSDGNAFSYFLENKLTKLANCVQFKRMLMFCLEDWRAGSPAPLGYATVSENGNFLPRLLFFNQRRRAVNSQSQYAVGLHS